VLYFMGCVIGVLGCQLTVGAFQERVELPQAVITVCGWLTTVLFSCIALLLIPRAEVHGTAPLHEFAYSALSAVASMWAWCLSVNHVPFVLLMLADSLKMPSVMLLLEFDARMLRWTGKRHGAFEFASVALVPIGCFVFSLYNYDSEERAEVASMLDSRIGGILLVLVHVFSLAFTSTWQASLFERHRLSIWPMMLWTSAFALLFSALASATEIADALESIGGFEGARRALPQIVATSLFFALGQFFALLIVQSYGALAIAAIMSVGQIGSGLTSIVVAHQSLGSLQVVGILLVALTLTALLRFKWHQKRISEDGKKARGDAKLITAEQATLDLSCLPSRCTPHQHSRSLALQRSDGSSFPDAFGRWSDWCRARLAGSRRFWICLALLLLFAVSISKAVVTDSLLSSEYARNHDVPATKAFVLGQPLPFLPSLKRVSDQVPKLPSAYCALTSMVTILLLLPVFALYPASFCTLRIEMVPALIVICFLVSCDVMASNVAIALELEPPWLHGMLALAPLVTLLAESLYQCKRKHAAVYLVVLLLTCGAALLLIGAFQEEYDEQEHEHPHAAWYTQMATSAMLLTLGLSAVKYVALHGITQSYWPSSAHSRCSSGVRSCWWSSRCRGRSKTASWASSPQPRPRRRSGSSPPPR
jgi:drug/metabolite transporter (DMT)-like permease